MNMKRTNYQIYEQTNQQKTKQMNYNVQSMTFKAKKLVILFVAAMLLSVAGVKAQYTGYNLALISVVSPTNDQLCTPYFLPVEVALANLGIQDYNFSIDTIGIGYEIIDSKGKTYDGYISIHSGVLLSGAVSTIEIMSALPIITGIYTFTIWVVSPIDKFSCDDTITYTYYSKGVITYDTVFICQGSAYNNGNFTNLTATGIYYDTLKNINSCDSIICLNLYIDTTTITQYSATFYFGNPYSDNNFTNLTQSGIYYDTLPNINGCDSIVCLTLTGLNASISGIVQRQDSTLLSSGIVMLYSVQSGGQYTVSDSITLSNSGGYSFENVTDGDYIVKFIPDSSENALPTYYGNTEFWYLADTVTITNNLPADFIDITLIPQSPMNGSSIINGYVGYGNEHKFISQKSVNDPAEAVNVYLQKEQNSTWTTLTSTLTNAEGYFEFRKVSVGKYRVILDIVGLKMEDIQIVEILNDGDSVQIQGYEITEDGIIKKDVGIVGARHALPLQIYPNPTTGQLRVSGDISDGKGIQIYDIVGRNVGTWHAASLQSENEKSEIVLDISHLANGMYFLKVDGKVFKIIKN